MRPDRVIIHASRLIAWLERGALTGLVAAMALLVLTNVVFRLFGVTLAWADELAVLCMTLSAFVGASLMLRQRRDPAVLIVHELASAQVVRALRLAVSALAAGFGVALAWVCWRWFDPAGLIGAGFDVGAFEMTYFNFIYTERTPVMGLALWHFFLVMPWFALTLTIHALANLAQDAGADPPRPGAPAPRTETEP